MLIPKVKEAFKKAVENVDISKMGLIDGKENEINDKYFTLNYAGYDFGGKEIKERQIKWLEMTNGTPPQRVLIPIQN